MKSRIVFFILIACFSFSEPSWVFAEDSAVDQMFLHLMANKKETPSESVRPSFLSSGETSSANTPAANGAVFTLGTSSTTGLSFSNSPGAMSFKSGASPQGKDSGGGGGECKADFIASYKAVVRDMQLYNYSLKSQAHLSAALEQFHRTVSFHIYKEDYFDFSKLGDLFSDENEIEDQVVTVADKTPDKVRIVTVDEITDCPESTSPSACALVDKKQLLLDCSGENSWLELKKSDSSKILRSKVSLHEAFWWSLNNTSADSNGDISNDIIDAITSAKEGRPLPKLSKEYDLSGPASYMLARKTDDRVMNPCVGENPFIVDTMSTVLVRNSQPQFIEGIAYYLVELVNNASMATSDWQVKAPSGCVGLVPFSRMETLPVARKMMEGVQFKILGFP